MKLLVSYILYLLSHTSCIYTLFTFISAIERAMAYLDTGELPWGMDLFDGQTEKRVHFVHMTFTENTSC